MATPKSIRSIALLAVVLILAALAIWFATRPARILESQRREALQEMAMIAAGIEVFIVPDLGHYPSPQQYASGVLDYGVQYNLWTPPVTVDPWGHPYQYRLLDPQGTAYELLSFGADGAPGGEGPAADIVAPSPH
jgi:general secretion pathway protein G